MGETVVSVLSFTDSVVSNNVASGGDGGVFVLPASRVGRQHRLSGCNFTGNAAAGRGGVGAWNWLGLPVVVRVCACALCAVRACSARRSLTCQCVQAGT
jgi:hypothetical protein